MSKVVTEGFLFAMGDGWLGKLVVGAVCAAVAWFARRPVERAAIMDVVNKRVESLMERQDEWIERVTRAHELCELNLAKLHDRVAQVEGELRQEKQVKDSMERAKE